MVPQFLKDKKRSWGEEITLKGMTLKLTFDFATERMVAIKLWNGIFSGLKENNSQPRIPIHSRIQR